MGFFGTTTKLYVVNNTINTVSISCSQVSIQIWLVLETAAVVLHQDRRRVTEHDKRQSQQQIYVKSKCNFISVTIGASSRCSARLVPETNDG